MPFDLFDQPPLPPGDHVFPVGLQPCATPVHCQARRASGAFQQGVGAAWQALNAEGALATCVLSGEDSATLVMGGFGFSLPAGATVLGVTVAVRRSMLYGDDCQLVDAHLSLWDVAAGGAVGVGDPKPSSHWWPRRPLWAVYGGPFSRWGLPDGTGGLTRDLVNATTFAAALRAREQAGSSGTAVVGDCVAAAWYRLL